MSDYANNSVKKFYTFGESGIFGVDTLVGDDVAFGEAGPLSDWRLSSAGGGGGAFSILRVTAI